MRSFLSPLLEQRIAWQNHFAQEPESDDDLIQILRGENRLKRLIVLRRSFAKADHHEISTEKPLEIGCKPE